MMTKADCWRYAEFGDSNHISGTAVTLWSSERVAKFKQNSTILKGKVGKGCVAVQIGSHF
jgi:hypothetical protein